MKILVLDNYDSFTYNLVQYIEEITGEKVDVFRNDEITVEAVDDYSVVILSPGPGLPADAGIMPELIKTYAGKIPILGVCLGHQAIGEAFGGHLLNLDRVYHGIETPVQITQRKEVIFDNIPDTFIAGRYHSWVVRGEELPECLEATAVAEDGVIMAMTHKEYLLKGVQFHPESVMTPYGKKMIANFLKAANVDIKFDPEKMVL